MFLGRCDCEKSERSCAALRHAIVSRTKDFKETVSEDYFSSGIFINRLRSVPEYIFIYFINFFGFYIKSGVTYGITTEASIGYLHRVS